MSEWSFLPRCQLVPIKLYFILQNFFQIVKNAVLPHPLRLLKIMTHLYFLVFMFPLLCVLLSFIDLLHIVYNFLLCHLFNLPQVLVQHQLFISFQFILKAQFLVYLMTTLGTLVVMFVENGQTSVVSHIDVLTRARSKIFSVPNGIELNFLVCFCKLAELAFIVSVIHKMVKNSVITIQQWLVLKLVLLHRSR